MPILFARALLVLGFAGMSVTAATDRVVPDKNLTPGDTLNVTKDDVCTPGYSKKVRNVPLSVKKQVFARYGIPYREHAKSEVDHAISLQLGGSNSIRNLFPEPYDLNVNGFQEGALEKDKAENATHRAVCKGQISLGEAQKQIISDWTVLYKRFVSPSFPKYIPLNAKRAEHGATP